jgi:hypothetical protein
MESSHGGAHRGRRCSRSSGSAAPRLLRAVGRPGLAIPGRCLRRRVWRLRQAREGHACAVHVHGRGRRVVRVVLGGLVDVPRLRPQDHHAVLLIAGSQPERRGPPTRGPFFAVAVSTLAWGHARVAPAMPSMTAAGARLWASSIRILIALGSAAAARPASRAGAVVPSRAPPCRADHRAAPCPTTSSVARSRPPPPALGARRRAAPGSYVSGPLMRPGIQRRGAIGEAIRVRSGALASRFWQTPGATPAGLRGGRLQLRPPSRMARRAEARRHARRSLCSRERSCGDTATGEAR